MSDHKDLITELKTLLKRCYDSKEGYFQVATITKRPELKGIFTSISEHRRNFIEEIQHEIQLLGGEPDESTSFKGDVHRTWISIKSTFSSNDDEAILEECIRGEASMIDDYENFLEQTDIPTNASEKIRKQLAQIKQDKYQMENLEKIVE